jgi:hypothetical protein
LLSLKDEALRCVCDHYKEVGNDVPGDHRFVYNLSVDGLDD